MAITVPVDFDADARGLDRELQRATSQAGRRSGGGFKKAFGLATAGISITGLAGIAKSAVSLEATFSSTMAQIAVATGAPKEQIKELSDLAIKLGADTVFSANEASEAMLELSKGGFTQAEIAAGGVQSVMALAATESLALGDAATIVANNMNAFGIAASDAATIADTLAAGSAASTASVQSLSEGLSNVGGVARSFGLDLQETVGVLSAFDQNALRGAEGGTAFRSMLTALANPSERASNLMEELGINLTDAQGRYKNITNIADQFRKALGKESEAERARSAAIIAGSYGQRALNILISEGAEGLKGYIKASGEQGKAQDLADARMSGTAGALEQLSGAWETLQLQLGQQLAPVIQDVANLLSEKAIPAISDLMQEFKDGTGTGGEIRDVLEDVGDALETVFNIGSDVVGFLNDLPGPVKSVAVQAALASVALIKLKAGFVAASTGAATLAASVTSSMTAVRTTTATTLPAMDRYTANSVVQQQRLAAQTTTTATSLRGLGGAATSVAGVGGMLTLVNATQESSKEMGLLKGAIGGALTGFAVSGGNPFGALIGGVGGGLLGVASAGNQAADGVKRATREVLESRDAVESYKTTLEGLNATMSKGTRTDILEQIAEGRKEGGALEGLQATDKQILNAVLGRSGAREALYAEIRAAYDDASSAVREQSDLIAGLEAQRAKGGPDAQSLAIRISEEKRVLDTLTQQAAVLSDQQLEQNSFIDGLKTAQDEQRKLNAEALTLRELIDLGVPKPIASLIDREGVSQDIDQVADLIDRFNVVDKTKWKAILSAEGLQPSKQNLREITRLLNEAEKERVAKLKIDIIGRAALNAALAALNAASGPRSSTVKLPTGDGDPFETKKNPRVTSQPTITPSSVDPSLTINQNYYGPTTGRERLAEIEWAQKYGTRARVGV